MNPILKTAFYLSLFQLNEHVSSLIIPKVNSKWNTIKSTALYVGGGRGLEKAPFGGGITPEGKIQNPHPKT